MKNIHRNTKHTYAIRDKEGRREPIYLCWVNIRQRCNNQNKPDYKYYGGKGIKVCSDWDTFSGFLADMGEEYYKHRKNNQYTTLERVDTSKDYSPSNCYWADRKTQARNRPGFTKPVTFKGTTLLLSDWADKLGNGFTRNILYDRIYKRGWNIERALTQPVAKR